MEQTEKKINCILLIDDDAATNFINKKIIQKTNIVNHVQVALNGREALDYISRQGKFASEDGQYLQPQLILLDINMPVMDGWEFIEAFQNLRLEHRKDIIVVMLSSSFNPADKTKAKTIEAITDFRQKPMSKEALLEIIHKAFPQVMMETVL